MLGNFGVKVPEAVSETLNGVSQVMSGLESIDLTKPFSAITGSVSILTGIGNTIADCLVSEVPIIRGMKTLNQSMKG